TITQVRTFTGDNLPALIQPTAVHLEMGILAGIIDQHEIRFYYLDDLTVEGEVPAAGTVSFPAPTVYDHGGALRFVGNRLYALGTNNGILALELTESDGASFEDWIAGFAITGDDAAEGADPAGDGVPNLLKYALGLDPLTVSRDALPVFHMDNDHLTLSFELS